MADVCFDQSKSPPTPRAQCLVYRSYCVMSAVITTGIIVSQDFTLSASLSLTHEYDHRTVVESPIDSSWRLGRRPSGCLIYIQRGGLIVDCWFGMASTMYKN